VFVVVTRPQSLRGTVDDVLREFSAVNAEVKWVPFISLEMLDEGIHALQIHRLSATSPSCLAFTSANAVDAFCAAMEKQGSDRSKLPQKIVLAAQGPETARAVERAFGRYPNFVPSDALSYVFAEQLASYLKQPTTVWYPTSSEAGADFDSRIREVGHQVVRLNLYAPRARELTPEERALFCTPSSKEALVLVFMSPSAVREAKRQLPGEGDPVWGKIRIVTIGPVTSIAVREVGWKVDFESRDHSVQGLIRLLNEVVLVS
jgi:uroporphyrinogen-III synthase